MKITRKQNSFPHTVQECDPVGRLGPYTGEYKLDIMIRLNIALHWGQVGTATD